MGGGSGGRSRGWAEGVGRAGEGEGGPPHPPRRRPWVLGRRVRFQIPRSSPRRGGGSFRPPTSCASSRPTAARAAASWALCCGVKGCTPPTRPLACPAPAGWRRSPRSSARAQARPRHGLARAAAPARARQPALQRALQQAETIVEVQKKLSEVLGIRLTAPTRTGRAGERGARAGRARRGPEGLHGSGCAALDAVPSPPPGRGGPRRSPSPRPTPARALSVDERRQTLEILHSPRFLDASPAEVHATLLDDGRYLCLVRTMYRLLASQGEVRERRRQLRHPRYRKPELLATGPNEVWSWDITKLRGPVKGSTTASTWCSTSSAATSSAGCWPNARASCWPSVPRRPVAKYPGRGPADAARRPRPEHYLEVGGSTAGRPRHPQQPQPPPHQQRQPLLRGPAQNPEVPPMVSGSLWLAPGRPALLPRVFPWYNHQHHHSGLAMLTPANVHFGRAPEILAHRAKVLHAAYAAHPERFRCVPRPLRCPRPSGSIHRWRRDPNETSLISLRTLSQRA